MAGKGILVDRPLLDDLIGAVWGRIATVDGLTDWLAAEGIEEDAIGSLLDDTIVVIAAQALAAAIPTTTNGDDPSDDPAIADITPLVRGALGACFQLGYETRKHVERSRLDRDGDDRARR